MKYTLIPEQSPVVGVHVDGVQKGWIYCKMDRRWFFRRVGEEGWTGPLATEKLAANRCIAQPLR